MTPTLDYIRNTYAAFNHRFFGDALGTPVFELSRSRTTLGQVVYRRHRNSDGTYRYSDFRFRITTRVSMDEQVLEDTILHEMIHYWILSNQWTDSSAHGMLFRHKMKELNTRHGRHVTISHRSAEELEQDRSPRQHFICVTRLTDGRVGFTPAVHTRLQQLRRSMKRFSGIKSQVWYITTDPYFNRFSRTMKPKIYITTEEVLQQHLADAHILL